MNPIKSWNLKKFLNLGVWDPETTFGPLGPKRRIKPYVQNNSYNFHKQDLIFSRVMRWIQQNHEISKNVLTLGFRTQKLHLGHLGPENILNHKSRILAAIFTNRASFSQESWAEFSKIMKSQKMSWPWGLGARNYIWATWAQKTYQAISPEPYYNFDKQDLILSGTMRWIQ